MKDDQHNTSHEKRMVSQVCHRDKKTWLSMDETGALYTRVMTDCPWEPVFFQKKYDGYYPKCKFKHILAAKGGFIAVAEGMHGQPYVYRSITGNVWEPIPLTGKNPDGEYKKAESRIIAALCHEKNNQIFFVCENGELITLPDCPDCVKFQKISCERLSKARWKDEKKEFIILTNVSGGERLLAIHQLSQFQITLSYAKQYCRSAYWVWIGEDGNRLVSESCPEKNICLKFNQLPEWLGTISRDTVICFACNNGTKSELAAYAARKKGYVNSYFLKV